MRDARDIVAIVLMAVFILVMVGQCKTGEAQMHGADPEPVNIANPEHIMVCWVVDDKPEECVSIPNSNTLNESQVKGACDMVRADVKRLVPDAKITKCGLMRDWL